MPSAVSTETHKELTILQLPHHLGFLASDVVLDNAVSAFFTKRAERASAYVNQHLRDPNDPSGLLLEAKTRSPGGLGMSRGDGECYGLRGRTTRSLHKLRAGNCGIRICARSAVCALVLVPA